VGLGVKLHLSRCSGKTPFVNDAELTQLLQQCAPQLGLRYHGFSNVRGQVLKRIARRIRQLGLPDVAAYRARLLAEPAEWAVLEQLCVVTLSRFYRDRAVWQALERQVMPELAAAARAAGEERLSCWSAGCASGEEPYTLAIVWQLALAPLHPGLQLRVLATDRHQPVLARAARARYQPGTLRELPREWRERAFSSHTFAEHTFAEQTGELQLLEPFRSRVELRQAELGSWLPEQTFRLILCRNVVFTYFEQRRQVEVLRQLLSRLAPGGALLSAPRERVPQSDQLEPWLPEHGIYRKRV
jgi:chemotaxis protein methyltransferase CheR